MPCWEAYSYMCSYEADDFEMENTVFTHTVLST